MAADSASSKQGFAKVLHKKVFRTKEKVLHTLGKADRTQDEVFDDHVSNFNRQQAAANKLQKELKNYISCIRAMQNASNNFYNAIKENYETEWTGYTEIVSAIEQLSFLWDDYAQRLQSEVMDPMSIYISKFPDTRSKISKRGRKLVDFDSSRHNLQALENAKKRDDGKIQKGEEDMAQAEEIYNTINSELHNELPTLFESRINFLASNFTSFFTVESKFQEESAKIKTSMAATTDELQIEFCDHRGSRTALLQTPKNAKIYKNGTMNEDNVVDLSRHDDISPESTPGGSHRNRKSGSLSSASDYSRKNDSDNNESGGQAMYQAPQNNTTLKPSSGAGRGATDAASHSSNSSHSTPIPKQRESLPVYHNTDNEASLNQDTTGSDKEDTGHDYEDFNYDDGSYEAIDVRKDQALPANYKAQNATKSVSNENNNENIKHSTYDRPPSNFARPAPSHMTAEGNDDEDDDDDDDEQVYKVPTSNEPISDNIPIGTHILYKVIATHSYQGEDTDELTFEAGETVCVIPWEDPEDQDEGWLYGIKESDGEKGVFPANFTKKL